jgi:hypothetical protein
MKWKPRHLVDEAKSARYGQLCSFFVNYPKALAYGGLNSDIDFANLRLPERGQRNGKYTTVARLKKGSRSEPYFVYLRGEMAYDDLLD